jgi:hypothetical protein
MSAPIAMQDLLAQIEKALRATLTFGVRQLEAPRWEPAPGSQAATELANTETRHNGDPWGQDIPRTSYAAANLLMTGVLDNLGSLCNLLGDPMTTIGPTVITRSALEIGATAWWLTEPGIGVRRRACRELALSLTSARRAKQVAEELDDPEGKAEGIAQEANVMRRIDDLAIGVPTGSRYSPQIEGEACPDATSLTAGMLKSWFPPDKGTTSFYRAYSAVTHGELYGLMNFMTPVTQPDGSTLLVWQLPAPVLDSTVQIAILAFREPFTRINHLMGWGRLETDLWSTKIQKIFNPPAPQGS